jgi:hypothetical protein
LRSQTDGTAQGADAQVSGLATIARIRFLGIAQSGLGALERDIDVAIVARHALLHPRDLHGGEPQHGHHQQQDQADDEHRALLCSLRSTDLRLAHRSSPVVTGRDCAAPPWS